MAIRRQGHDHAEGIREGLENVQCVFQQPCNKPRTIDKEISPLTPRPRSTYRANPTRPP